MSVICFARWRRVLDAYLYVDGGCSHSGPFVAVIVLTLLSFLLSLCVVVVGCQLLGCAVLERFGPVFGMGMIVRGECHKLTERVVSRGAGSRLLGRERGNLEAERVGTILRLVQA